MNAHEIVTLQIGHYSNFIGTHWWNIQESNFVYKIEDTDNSEINHDVLFREGINQHKQVTYTPRLIAFDLKGSLNCMKLETDLYSTTEARPAIAWGGPITEIRQEILEKNEFQKDLEDLYCDDETVDDESSEQDEKPTESEPINTEDKDKRLKNTVYNLDNEVKVWSDYRRFGLHPKSLTIINEYQHENETDPFNQFDQGTELYRNYDVRCEFEDKVHKFVEECDYLQALQVITDCHSGFAGFSASILDDLEDDYGNKSLLVMPCAPIRSQRSFDVKDADRNLNTAFLLANSYSHSNAAILPLALDGLVKGSPPEFSHAKYNRQLDYHTSALLSICIDNATLPFRSSKNSFVKMYDILRPLTVYDRKLISIQACLPFPMEASSTLFDALNAHSESLPWQRITNHLTKADITTISQSIVLRGIDSTTGKEDRSTKESLLNEYLTQFCPSSFNMTYFNSSPCNLRSPMPQHIFTELDKDGFSGSISERVTSIPVLTSVQQNSEPSQWLTALAKMTAKMRPNHIEVDILTELNDNLLCHSDLYLDQ